MIILNEIAEKLSKILNGLDSEIEETNPTDFKFLVATQGFHLDKISDKATGKNMIPVFVGSMGGRFNAVPDLLEEDVSIPITMYFPIRFKNDFFGLNEFIARVFVGKKLNYGTTTGYAISNISVAQYGELQQLDLKEFRTWVADIYQEEISTIETYMSMTFTLYLSSMASGYKYGNDVSVSLTYGSYTDTPTFVNGSMQSNSEPVAQQLLGATHPESEGLAVNTAYGNSFAIYYKSTTFYQTLLQKWFDGDIQNESLTLTITFDSKTYTRTVYIQSVNMNIAKGSPITLTLTFSKKVSL